MKAGLVQPLLSALGFPDWPPGQEGVLWRHFARVLRRLSQVVLAGTDEHTEAALIRLVEMTPFLRLPRWSDTAVRLFALLKEELPCHSEGVLATWQRRFLSDLAGLEAVLGHEATLPGLRALVRRYPRVIATWPREEVHPSLPVLVREDAPAEPLRDELTEIARRLELACPFRDLEDAALRLLPQVRVALSTIPRDDPRAWRSALADLLHFLGVPRLPPELREAARSTTFSPEGVALLLAPLFLRDRRLHPLPRRPGEFAHPRGRGPIHGQGMRRARWHGPPRGSKVADVQGGHEVRVARKPTLSAVERRA